MFSEWTKNTFYACFRRCFFSLFLFIFCFVCFSHHGSSFFFCLPLWLCVAQFSSEFKSSSIAEFADTQLKCLLQPWLDLPLSFLSTYTVIWPQPLQLNFTYFSMPVDQWIRLLFLYFLRFVCLFWFLFVAACLCLAICFSFSFNGPNLQQLCAVWDQSLKRFTRQGYEDGQQRLVLCIENLSG